MACSSVWTGGKREPPKTAIGLYSFFVVLAQVQYGPCSYGLGGRWHAQVFGQGGKGEPPKTASGLYGFFIVLAQVPYGPCSYGIGPRWHAQVFGQGEVEPPKTANGHYNVL